MFKLTLARRKVLWAYAFLFAPLAFFLYIRIYPTLFAFDISLHEWNPLSVEQKYVALKNYQTLLIELQKPNSVTSKAFVNTAKYVVLGMPIQLALALGIALMLNQIRRLSTLFRVIYFIPFVTSTVAISWVFRWLYQPQFGPLNLFLSFIGLPQQPFLKSPNQALYSILAVAVWQGLGFSVIIFLAGLKQIPDVYYDAAKIDGAARHQTFWYITMPLLNSSIVYLVVLQSINFLRMFVPVLNMSNQGDGGPLNSTTTVVLRVYREAFSHFRMGYASALTVALFLIILVVTIVQLRVTSRQIEY